MNLLWKRISLFVLVLSILLHSNFVTASFLELKPNTFYKYNLKTSNWSLETTSNSAQGTGLQFLGKQYSEDTDFNILTGENIYEDGVNYLLYIGSDVINLEDTNDTSEIYAFTHLHTKVLLIDSIWNQSYMEMGPYLLCPYFFFNIKSFSEIFSAGSNFDGIDYQALGYNNWTANGGDVYEEKRSTYLFGFVYDFSYRKIIPDPDNPLDSISYNYSGIIKTKIEYDSTHGILKGYNFFLESAGFHNNQSVSFNIEQIVEADGFRIGDFDDISNNSPGFDLIISVLVISILSIITISVKKRRQTKR